MKKILISFTFLIITTSINAQNIFGKWHSTNENTGEVDSVIEVYKKDGKEIISKLVKDSNFLANQGLMDYSLLLIVEESKNKSCLKSSAIE